MKENELYHGARIHSKLYHTFDRFLRPNVGRSTIPFDWSKGVVGKPVYNVKNQFQSSSCWGQMFSQMMRIKLGGDELSAKSAYSPIFAIGGGVNLSLGYKEASVFGLTTEVKVPSLLNGSCTESFMEDKTWMTAKMIDDCFTRRGWKVVNVSLNIDSSAQAIRDYGCIGILIQGQDNGSWLSPYPTAPIDNSNLWGHYMCSDSNVPVLINGKKYLKFYQSWGVGVGENGFQYISEDYINSGYIADIFTFTK